VTLIGANGAGKSTTLRSINGLNHPRRGRISFQGRDITNEPAHSVVKLGIAQSPEGRKLFPRMTVVENLEMGAFQRSDRAAMREDMDRVFQLFPRLAERRGNRGRQLSGGEQEMLSIGRALLLNPKLLILDEPSQGLAPLIVREVFRVVARMRDEGISVLLVEQNVRMSLEISDHVYVLDDGKVVHSGAAAELAADEERVRAMAGASAEEWSLPE